MPNPEVAAKVADALLLYLSAQLSPTFPIAMPNVKFKREDEAYLAATHFLNDPVTTSLAFDSTDLHRGIFQVSVFWPTKEGDGIIEPLEAAGQVIAALQRGTMIEHEGLRVRVERQPWAATPLPEKGWLQVPVSVPWTCDA